MKNKKPQLKKQKLTTGNILVILACAIFSLTIGLLSGDPIIGSLLLATGFIDSYLASLQKRSNYIFGFANSLLIAYVGFKNGLYGSFISNIFVFAPLQIYGLITWSRNLGSDKNVKIRKLNRQNSILVTGACVIGSVIFGYLLTKIPTQRTAFLDATICCIDACALVMTNLRYRESWWLWVVSGVLSIIVWIGALLDGGPNSFMRLISAIGFLIINIYGAIKWGAKFKGSKKH